MVSKKDHVASESHPESHEKKEEVVEIPIGKYFSGVRKNPWIAATFVLALALVLVLVFGNGGSTGTVSAEQAGENVMSFIQSNPEIGDSVSLVSTEEEGQFYVVTLSYQGQNVPVYATKDGKYLVGNPVELTQNVEPVNRTQTSTSVPKSDRPKVELFVWGYCPYGVQAQGPLAEVAALLKDSADFEVVLYYDGHGPFETQQNKIQACIQETAPDKYWAYAAGFVKNIYPKCSTTRDVECDKSESVALMKTLGIDSSKVMTCVADKGDELVGQYSTRASEYGVTGSPTLVVNGVKVSNVARNAEAFKNAVCGSFNNAPAECEQVLDSGTAAAAGNC